MFNFNANTQIRHTDRNEVYTFHGFSAARQTSMITITFQSTIRRHQVNFVISILNIEAFAQMLTNRNFEQM